MTCFYPISGYRGSDGVVRVDGRPFPINGVPISCGQCHGCKVRRSADWAIRLMHECLNYEDAVFATFTYEGDEWIEASLVPKHIQDLWKRIRYYRGELKKFGPVNDRDLNQAFKYFCGSEYGTEGLRPHFHAIIFGMRFNDRKYWKTLPSGFEIYRSAALEKLWPHGFSSIGSVTFESAQYCASYIVHKENGRALDEYCSRYTRVDRYTGEVRQVEPERGYMSLRPCIGESFSRTFTEELKRGYVLLKGGAKVPLPKKYNEDFKNNFALEYRELEKERKEHSVRSRKDRTPERLAVREEVAIARSKLKRGAL